MKFKTYFFAGVPRSLLSFLISRLAIAEIKAYRPMEVTWKQSCGHDTQTFR